MPFNSIALVGVNLGCDWPVSPILEHATHLSICKETEGPVKTFWIYDGELNEF